MRTCVLMIMTLLAAALATPAQACMWSPQPKFAFWDRAPETIVPGEVVVEVEFVGLAYPVVTYAVDGKASEETVAFSNSCGEPFAYDIRRVIKGEITIRRIIVFSDVDMIDETMNPWRRRILVGTPGDFHKVTPTSDKDWGQHAYNAQWLAIRVPEVRAPSGVEVFLSRAESIFFAIAGLLGKGLANIVGQPALTGPLAWIAPATLLVLLVSIIALTIWLLRRRKTR